MPVLRPPGSVPGVDIMFILLDMVLSDTGQTFMVIACKQPGQCKFSGWSFSNPKTYLFGARMVYVHYIEPRSKF
jgi:hypothetical protein